MDADVKKMRNTGLPLKICVENKEIETKHCENRKKF